MTVIYQIYPRSFQDSNGDGIGDLPGIIQRLPYLASLGVDLLWLSPFFQSPQKDFGYDVSDYRTVEPLFGNNDDLKRLIETASHHNLGIMVDLVFAHTSSEHPWFQASRSGKTNEFANWYVWRDARPDGTPPNNWQSIFGGPAWRWDQRRRQYYLTHFLAEQPALNLYHAPVEQELLDIVDFWLRQGVKGFRFDAIYFAHFDQELRDNPPVQGEAAGASAIASTPFSMQQHIHDMAQPATLDFIRKLRQVAARYEGITLLGEVVDSAIAQHYVGDDRFDIAYCFDLLDLRGPVSAPQLAQKLQTMLDGFPANRNCWALSNHDVPRHISRMAPLDQANRESSGKLLAALMHLLPGGLCLYQGEELGLPQARLTLEQMRDPYDIAFYPDHIGRDGARTPMIWDQDAVNGGFSTGKSTWLPIEATHLPLAPDRQVTQPNSMFAHYARLLKWRRANPTRVIREITTMAENAVLVVKLQAGEPMTAYFNCSAKAVVLNLPGHAWVWQHGLTQTNGTVQLAPYGFSLGLG